MSDLDGLINLIPIDDIAKKLGVDPSIAKAAVAVAVPAIVGGLSANAASAGGAEKITNAVTHHADVSTNIDDIDTADGKKIVSHVFGSKTDDVVAAAAKSSKGGVDLGPIIQQVLPIIAPIVLAFLAQQLTKGSSTAAAAPKTAAPAASSGGDIGSLLGGLLANPETQSVVGGLLGGLLGGGTK